MIDNSLPLRTTSPWNDAQVRAYLDSERVPLRLSVDSREAPLIVPLWFTFDGSAFWCASPARAYVAQVVGTGVPCGFDVSSNAMPYRGVRGQGRAVVVPERGAGLIRLLVERYLEDADSDFARWLLSRAAQEVAIRIEPGWITAWDFAARMSSALSQR